MGVHGKISMMNLFTILMNEDVVSSINDNLDYLLEVIPEIKYMIGFDHKHPHHHLDVWNHTLYALSLSESDFEIRLCLLLHDIGKPFSYTDGEIRHFNGHAEVSSKMSEVILKRIGFEESFIQEVCYLIRNHDMPLSKKEIERNRTLAMKRYLIQYCDGVAHHPDMLEKRKEYLVKVKRILEQ